MKEPIEKVEEQIYQKRRTVRYDIRDLTVEMINKKYVEYFENDEKSLENINQIYVPDYQRDFTWDNKRQSKLIESIILGLPIPFIFIAENKDSSWEIVDGSQRIRTINNFISNKLILEDLNSLNFLNGYKYEDLEPSRRGKFLSTALRIIVLSEETTEDVKKDMFERINNGSDLLKPMEKRKGLLPGAFNDFIYKFCRENKKYAELTPIDKWLEKRQEREELLLRFFALSENKKYEKGVDEGIAKFLDSYMERKNKEWGKLSSKGKEVEEKVYSERIERVCDFVDKYFPFGFRYAQNPQTKRSVFEAISIGVDKYLNEENKECNLSKEEILDSLNSNEFKKNTKIANELHRKSKLSGRVLYVFDFLMKGQKK